MDETALLEKTLQDRVVVNNPNLTSNKIKHIILHNPLRQYFIKQVKEPLLRVIIALAGKYPKPTKANTDTLIAHTLLDIFAEFHKFNKVKPELFHAAERVFVDEIEHDSVYTDLFQVFLEYIIEAILGGKWEARRLNKPAERYWSEVQPYGGKYSIVHKIQEKRLEILGLLGIDERDLNL